MAPFNTHFLVAEKIWPELDGPWQDHHYGQFCFGCVAPDVDKLSPTLTQIDTHFFDRTGKRELMASHRTATFLQRQAEFLGAPFADLCSEAQAFALGYLCHLAVDEVSKHMWGYSTWMHFRDIGPGPAFAALDELARQRMQNYPAVVEALGSIQVLDIIPHIPTTDLEAYLQGVHNFTKVNTIEGEFLALLDMFLKPDPEQQRKMLQEFAANIKVARRRIRYFRLDTLIRAGLLHSRERLADLIAGRIPEPGYPALE